MLPLTQESVETMSETETNEAYADDVPLTHLFGESARTKIIAALVGNKNRDLSASELARQAGIARPTVYEHIDDLAEIGAVDVDRETKQGKRYRLSDGDLGESIDNTAGYALRNLLEAEGHL